MMDGDNVDQILAGMEHPQLMDEPEPEEMKAQDSVPAPDVDDGMERNQRIKRREGMDVDGEDIDQILAVKTFHNI
jgi:translation initiation factor 5B